MFDVDDGDADESGRNEASAIAAWNTRPMIAATQQATGEGVALADKLEAIVNLGWAKGDDAIIREAARTLRALSTPQAVSPPEGAPVLPVEVRSGDVWSNIKARLAAQINLAEDHLNSTVSIRLRDAKAILSTITGDA